MKDRNLNFKKGMTFIELIVVIGIFATISGVVLFNFSGFSTNISLQNLSNQIALQLKKSQTEALSGAGGSALFTLPNTKPSYGIYFDTTTPSQFSYFADYNNNGLFPGTTGCGTAGAECRDQITIQTSDRITRLCVNDAGTCTQSNLAVSFARPFPDAIFKYGSFVGTISSAQIEIKSAKNFYKTIIVRSTGQIEIRDGCINKIFFSTAC